MAFALGILAGTAAALVTTPSHADNPIVQTLYTADPAPFVHEGTLYLYTTHDEDVTVNDFFTMNDWRVYSTTDVVNWTDHGSPLHYNDFSWAGGSAWAGQVTYRNGRFYFYVPVVRSSGGNVIGVGVSDSPFGPFEDAIGSPLINPTDCGDIDPTVFIDDGGQAYLYWGNPNLCYVLLNEDMISYQGDVVRVPMNTDSFGVRTDSDRPTSYEEGPWFYKREDRYYMVYPGGPLPEHIAYSTSTSPTGPWDYQGVIMPAQGGSFTNHPGVIDYKGKSLFFYHNAALPGGGGFKRSVCVEEFSYGADGSIPEMQMTSEGASAADVLKPFAQVEAETIAWQSGIETEPCTEGGMNVTEISGGDYIKVKDVEFGAGATAFEMRVAAASGGASVELRLDGEGGMLVGSCAVESTGGEQSWATQTCSVDGASGKHDLFLVFTGGGFDFNWWRFDGPGDPGPGTDGPGGAAGTGGTSNGGTAGSGAAVGGGMASGGMPSPAGGSPARGGSGPGPNPASTPAAPTPSAPAPTATSPATTPTPGTTVAPVPTSDGAPSAPGTSPGGLAGAAGMGDPAVASTAGDESCGCRVVGASAGSKLGAWIALIAAFGVLRRRAVGRAFGWRSRRPPRRSRPSCLGTSPGSARQGDGPGRRSGELPTTASFTRTA